MSATRAYHTSSTMSILSPAAHAVFSTYELRLNILLHLPVQALLCCTMVSPIWKATIERSAEARQFIESTPARIRLETANPTQNRNAWIRRSIVGSQTRLTVTVGRSDCVFSWQSNQERLEIWALDRGLDWSGTGGDIFLSYRDGTGRIENVRSAYFIGLQMAKSSLGPW